MREIVKKNKVVYNYTEHIMSDGVKVAILLYVIAILLLMISVLISYLYMGDAPSVVAGFGLSSIIFNVGSMVNVILEVYLYNNFHPEIRTMLVLQLILFAVWIFII